MKTLNPTLVLEDDCFLLEHSDFCRVPGYLVLRLKTGARSLSELQHDESQRLSALLCAAAAAIETVVGADRVYCLSFCELDRRLHFHLFPRTTWLLVEYLDATGTHGEPVNGPMLFEWAREAYGTDAELPPGIPPTEAVCDRLREIMNPA